MHEVVWKRWAATPARGDRLILFMYNTSSDIALHEWLKSILSVPTLRLIANGKVLITCRSPPVLICIFHSFSLLLSCLEITDRVYFANHLNPYCSL